MAPDLKQVERHTFDVLQCLFDDEPVGYRSGSQGSQGSQGDIETDGPDDDTFDAVLIADKLRAVADALNEDVKFKAAMKELKNNAAQAALEKALSSGIDVLVQTQVGQRSEVAPELQIIKASVAFGLYLKKTCPNLRGQLQSTIGSFLNERVGSWVAEQGGWEQVASVSSE